MKRVSLSQKIEICQKYGTLKTYTLKEALDHFRDFTQAEEEMAHVRARYEAGKYLCGFVSNGKLECLETVYQIGSLSFFVKELIYELIQIELNS